ncbi:MAG: methyltransferase protein [Pseudonocardiales bacterium]|nr:methyltransferase protein [Pseudonocardiales bacterium]
MCGYVGVEPDEQSFTIARERIEPLGGQVIHGLSDEVAPDGQFDAVCAFEVLEHLEHDTDALADWLLRVRPGGAAVVSVPAWPDRFTVMDEMVGHFRRYRPDEIDAVLEKAGLTEVRHVLYGWPLGYALEAARTRIAKRRGVASEDAMAARSATSGRLFQPKRVAGAVVRVGAAPFTAVQKLRPGVGTGLVAVGVRPLS